MAQQIPSDSDRAETGDMPMQPTGSGATDLEIAKLQTAVAQGTPDPEIETGIVNDGAASTRDDFFDRDGVTGTQP